MGLLSRFPRPMRGDVPEAPGGRLPGEEDAAAQNAARADPRGSLEALLSDPRFAGLVAGAPLSQSEMQRRWPRWPQQNPYAQQFMGRSMSWGG